MELTIAVIAAGAMGSAVGRRLAQNGATVLTSLTGRSAASRAQAEAAGMIDADDRSIVERCSLILSIVPPSEAKALATRFQPLLAGHAGLVFADCNAIGVATMTSMSNDLEAAGARCADGAIIGYPPEDGERGPTFYFSGEAAGSLSILSSYGLDVRIMDAPIGAASALKLSYAGITKGLVAVATTMILAAERAGAGPALKRELAASQPHLLARFERTLPDMYSKAYRWVEEMHAIAAFIGDDQAEASIYEGAAGLYDRIASPTAGSSETAAIDRFFGRVQVTA